VDARSAFGRDFEWNVRRGAEDAWKMGGSDEDSTFRVETSIARGLVRAAGTRTVDVARVRQRHHELELERESLGLGHARGALRRAGLVSGQAYRTRCCVDVK
jgi:hypothetical protein